MTTFYLIRHATNDLLKEGRLGGRMPGVHLNEEGRAQAQALAERLAQAQLAAIYASPLERAQETARPLADRLGLPVRIHPGLHETDCGAWSGERIEVLRRRRLWRELNFHAAGTRFPGGGETAWEVQARMVAALEEIRAAHPQGTVAVFSHADPLRIAVAHYVGLPLDLFRRLLVEPASLTVLSLGGPWPRLLCLNDTAHLSPPGSGKGV